MLFLFNDRFWRRFPLHFYYYFNSYFYSRQLCTTGQKSLKFTLKMLTVMLQLVNRLMHIGQRRMQLTFLESTAHFGLPTLRQLLEGAHIHIAVMKKS